MAVKGSVPELGMIIPHIVVEDTQEALDFYTRAFSAAVLYRSSQPNGQGEHVHLRLWASLIQLSTEDPDYRKRSMEGAFIAAPRSLGGTTCVFQVRVPDVDAAFQQAVDNGALPAVPPTDMFWGDRYGWIRDPFGHLWALCTVREVLSEEEIASRMAAMAATKGPDHES